MSELNPNQALEKAPSPTPLPLFSLYFLLARFILILSLPLEGLKGYGDFWNYYGVASLGRPFLDLWVEYPPLFPLLSRGIYLLVGGREQAFIYLLAALFSAAQAASILLVGKIALKLYPEEQTRQLTLFYAFILVCLFYGWAYFDSLVVLLMLLAIQAVLDHRDLLGGAALGIGGLLKWFPLVALPALWRRKETGRAARATGISLLVVGTVWGVLALASPAYTKAAFSSQNLKGSWETVWAVLDGNLSTGNFSEEIDRLDPASAFQRTGAPAVVPPWLSLTVFGALGLYVFLRSDLSEAKAFLSFIALTFVMFLLWSPGYSPQWVLYLLPLLLFSFPPARGKLVALTLVLLNLLEWPILLSRGMFSSLVESILLRTLVLIVLAGSLAWGLLGSAGRLKDDSLEKN